MLTTGIRRDRLRFGAVLPPEQRRGTVKNSSATQACPEVEALERDDDSFLRVTGPDDRDPERLEEGNEQEIETARKEEQHRIDTQACDSCTPNSVQVEIPVFTERGDVLTPQRCVKCHNSSSFRMRHGPDGPGTLCHKCGIEYAQCRLPLYQREDGILTAVHETGFHLVEHHGFESRLFPRRGRDLTRPITTLSKAATGQPSGTQVEQNAAQDEEEEKKTMHDSDSPAISAGPRAVGEVNRVQTAQTVTDGFLPVTTGGSTGKGRSEAQVDQLSASMPTVQRVISKNTVKQSSTLIYVKAVLNIEGKLSIRRFPISYGMSFNALQGELQRRFETQKVLKIMYEDNEGDLVIVSADVEVDELYRLAYSYKISPLRLRLGLSDDQ